MSSKDLLESVKKLREIYGKTKIKKPDEDKIIYLAMEKAKFVFDSYSKFKDELEKVKNSNLTGLMVYFQKQLSYFKHFTRSLTSGYKVKSFEELIDITFPLNPSPKASPKDKSFELSILNSKIKYQLTRTGCTFQIYNSNGFCTETCWTRMGWRRASKIRALPNLFAKSEADAQIDRTI